MKIAAVLMFALASCIGGGTGLDLPVLDVVYQCEAGGLEVAAELELCWDGAEDDLEDSIATALDEPVDCMRTRRHLGPCLYRCDSGRGCNARNGCWCPVEGSP